MVDWRWGPPGGCWKNLWKRSGGQKSGGKGWGGLQGSVPEWREGVEGGPPSAGFSDLELEEGPRGHPSPTPPSGAGCEVVVIREQKMGKVCGKRISTKMWALAHRAVKRIAWDHTARKGGGGSANLAGADG